MGVKTCTPPEFAYKARLHGWLFDHFHSYNDADAWTKLTADTTATVASGDFAGGQIKLYTDTTNNNEVMVKSTNKSFIFANNTPLMFETRIQFTEANTDDDNVAVGFSSAAAADLLLDNGAGPATTMSGAMIYKVDGSNVWKCITSLSTTQTISTSTATAGGTNFQVLKIKIDFVSSTVAEATFWLNGAPLIDAAQTSRNTPIKHAFTYTSAAAMNAVLYAKTGGSQATTLYSDYVYAGQETAIPY